MYHKYYYSILILFIVQVCSSFSLPLVIPIGKDCGPAGYLRYFNIRKVAYPLDWLVTDNFDDVCNLIEEKFALFLEANVLRLNQNGRGIYNFHNNIEFIHDFPTTSHNNIAADDGTAGTIRQNFLDYLDGVKNKYKPRIARFFDALNGADPVIFIRTHIPPNQAQKFVTLMQQYYPNLNYTLAIVHKKTDETYTWSIPNVVNFYVDPIAGSQQCYNDWQNMFTQLGLSTKKLSDNPTRKPVIHTSCSTY